MAPQPAEDSPSTDDVASGSGFGESGGEDGDEDGDDASNDGGGGGACARVPAAPGGAARLHGDDAL